MLHFYACIFAHRLLRAGPKQTSVLSSRQHHSCSRLRLLRHMRHQELWRAVGTRYGPTQIYGPTGHAIGGTAQQALRSFYRSYCSRALAPSVTTTGRQRSVGVWTSPPPPGPARLARVDYWPAMQLADEDLSDAVRRDRGPRDRRERADASVREHGTRSAVQVNSTWHALVIYYSD